MDEIVNTCGPECAKELSRRTWDVIVIGAGPAGTLAARQIALKGLGTLLIDGKHFPREKVCGGFLNSRAMNALSQNGLGHVAAKGPEPDVTQVQLIRGRQRRCFPLPAGRAICRTIFDHSLLTSAKVAGAVILTGCNAVVEATCDRHLRRVTVLLGGLRQLLETQVVICADGLSRTSIRHLPEFTNTTAVDSRFGIGATIEGELGACARGQITLVLSGQAYVGISRVGSRQFNVAAAVDRSALVQPPGKLVADIFKDAGICCPPNLVCANWRGTPPLTSRARQVAGERVLVIGDAGGYIEPFTGEGMATALESANAIVPLVEQAAKSWEPAIGVTWEFQHRQMVRERERTCRQLAWILRRPWAAAAALNVCRAMPGIAGRVIAKTSLPSRLCQPIGLGDQ